MKNKITLIDVKVVVVGEGVQFYDIAKKEYIQCNLWVRTHSIKDIAEICKELNLNPTNIEGNKIIL